MTTEKFRRFFAQWQRHIQDPRVRRSSNPRDYVDCEPYREIVKLGKPALPLIVAKMRGSQKKEEGRAQFFLWRAVREISGVDLVRRGETASEQEMAQRYLQWWDWQDRKRPARPAAHP